MTLLFSLVGYDVVTRPRPPPRPQRLRLHTLVVNSCITAVHINYDRFGIMMIINYSIIYMQPIVRRKAIRTTLEIGLSDLRLTN